MPTEREKLEDIEYQLRVASQGGVAMADEVDMTKAHIIPYPPSGFQGMRPREGFVGSAREKRYADFNKLLEESGQPRIQDENVYAIGESNADPALFAHEFRHGTGLLDASKHGESYTLEDYERPERQHRIWDGFRADSRDQWYEAVIMWRDLRRTEGTEGGKGYSWGDAEKDLLEEIEKHQERFSTQEAEAEYDYNTQITGRRGENSELDQYKELAAKRFKMRQELIAEEEAAFKKKWNKD